MAIKKSMKEWGVSNEMEMLREIIQQSPLLREKVGEKMRVLKETASQNLFDDAAKAVEKKMVNKRADKENV